MKSGTLLLALLSSIFKIGRALAPSYSCGNVWDDFFVEAPAPITGKTTSLTVKKSAPDTLCVLVRITAANEEADLNDISTSSNLVDFDIVPVARSHDGNVWERVAGPYAHMQNLKISNCANGDENENEIDGGINIFPNSSQNLPCVLEVAILSNLDEGKFIFMPFQHSLPDKAIVSRFFHQTTFGPTMEMLDAWNYDSDLSTEMAAWVHAQMDVNETPITSHREFFRKNIDASLEEEEDNPDNDSLQIYKVRTPCDEGARWLPYSFTVDDFGEEFTVTRRNDGKYLIEVAGVPRTLMDEWKAWGTQLRTGVWKFAHGTDEMVGGRLLIHDSFIDKYYVVQGGNPPVYLDFTSPSITYIDSMPWRNFGSTPAAVKPFYWRPNNYFGETLYLETGIEESKCDAVDIGNAVHIMGIMDDDSKTQLWYGRFAELDENTLDSPIPSGGGDLVDAGGLCSNPIMNWQNSESCYISIEANACNNIPYENVEVGDAVVICGSPGEIANDAVGKNMFQIADTTKLKSGYEFANQKKNAWSMIALESNDQLRQRVAWALSQILVVTPNQIEEVMYAEIYLNYYDIFVNHAFGNYFDILKEVSYSPMMGEMLSYVNSRSRSYVLKKDDQIAFPDENYAREIMQLFTIGVHKLNMDGTMQLDPDGSPILTYDNTDIQNFARAWTAFVRSPRRSNVETRYWDDNRIDPMHLEGKYRDPFPKMGLDGSYIGDKYPLCADEPNKAFLRKGATYRLVGSSKLPLLHSQPSWWFNENYDIKVLSLSTRSQLYAKLCNGTNGNCNHKPVVVLDENLSCSAGDAECRVDDIRLVQVGSDPAVHYEYVRVPCVQLAFYQNSKTIQHRNTLDAMCADGDLPLASDSCCENPQWTKPGGASFCEYSTEKTTFATSKARCEANFPEGSSCAWVWWREETPECFLSYEQAWYWTSEEPCQLQAKVTSSGTVAIVHTPHVDTDGNYKTDINVQPSNTNYFKVSWADNEYPDVQSNCDNLSCFPYNGIECLCDITVEEVPVFFDAPSISEILSKLHIGGVNIDRFDEGEYTLAASTDEVKVYHKNGRYDTDTVFLAKYLGHDTYFKNMESVVHIDNTSYSFRNPPSFLSPALHEGRDAMHETDAVLKHYFHNPNVPPFLAQRIIQRLGISNPSPGYIEAVATAFSTGTYSNDGHTFGDGRYGNLGAMVAAIVLEPEARIVLLDADPTAGSLREPIIKVMSYLRAMEFEKKENAPELRFYDMQQKIGQMAHAIPNVFSFFLPEYSAPGKIKAASLVSPEAQVMSGPKITSLINGLFSMVDLGLTQCFGGFGDKTTKTCNDLLNGNEPPQDYNRGSLTYNNQNTDPSDVVDNIALLLTGGRLHDGAKDILMDAYEKHGGLEAVQKLMTVVPEFHSSGVVRANSEQRPGISNPEPSDEPYKAIVFLMLNGGADSYNMLVPHSGCNGKDMWKEYKNARAGLAIAKDSLLQIDASDSDQICSKFGVHPNLQHLKTLYDDEDLLWVSNLGVLQDYSTKENWRQKHDDTALFAHNVQVSEVSIMDIYEEQAGRGVGGRMLDVLLTNGFIANAISVENIAQPLVSNFAPMYVVPSNGIYEKFDPISAAIGNDPEQFLEKAKELNSATMLGSGLFSETYSSLLHQGLAENKLLYDSLKAVTLDTTFADAAISNQLETVAKMMKTKDSRGVDRDIFYVEMTGYDTHSDLNTNFDRLTEELNEGLKDFTAETKIQGMWDSITIVMVTEFARTLTENTGQGSDHAWGGNYFVAGGPINGGKIIGSYPDHLNPDGPLVFEPGIVIPTTPWESVWNGVAQWFGVTNPADLNVVLPNRNTFAADLFDTGVLYGYDSTLSPTVSPTSGSPPTPSPTASPTPSLFGCEDSTLSFPVSGVKKNCAWVAKNQNVRCKLLNGEVKKFCPKTCDECDNHACKNPRGNFYVKKKKKSCAWVKKKKKKRCKIKGVSTTCRTLCSTICQFPVIDFVGNPCTDIFGAGMCEVCTGDCDVDEDCADDLRCAKRDGGDLVENVPGCRWDKNSKRFQSEDDDFCFKPTSEPGIVNYVGECGEEDYLCGECEGDCDNDSHCEPGLKCMKRDGFEDIPGCEGAGGLRDMYGRDICYKPTGGDIEINYVGNPCNDYFESGFCEVCNGDCDSDADCEGNLRCAKRNAKEHDVPGCVWGEGSERLKDKNDDYCFMPTSEPGVINYVGECGEEDYLCGKCEGDCDDDSHCEPGLKCMRRNDFEGVPGCVGAGGSRDMYGRDICYTA